MTEPVTISLKNLQQNSQNFAYVREEALQVIRRLAPETWTDHNLHDPGITILEALSYALTEAGLLSAMDMPDLLASGERLAPQEFFTAAAVLPSAPVSIADFRKILIDHPLIRRAWVSTIYGEPLGRLSVLLEFEKTDLNSNVIRTSVSVPPTVNIEFALPYWDDPDVMALQSNVLLQLVTFELAWQPIEGSDAWFARISVDYEPPGGGTLNFKAWVVVQITTPQTTPPINVSAILSAAATSLQTLGDGSPADQSILKQYNRRVIEAFETSRQVRRYARGYRNLCENLAEYNAVRIQEVALSAHIEVATDVQVENLLADIFYAVDRHISSEIEVDSLASLQEKGISTEDIFDGPLPKYGFVATGSLDADLPLNKLFTSDIIRLIFQLRRPGGGDVQTREDITSRSIIAVRNLALSLYIDNRSIATEARDCLQLINSIRYIPRLSAGKCYITFVRNGVEVAYDIDSAIALFEAKKSTASAPGAPLVTDLSLPGGTSYALSDYYPVQNSLPVTYGVGVHGLSNAATVQRKAQAKQLKGYLFFFEQILAGYFSQLANVNAFFSANPAVVTTLYQQTLYDLSQASDLFVDFDPAIGGWDAFRADTQNAYAKLLATGVETEDQFIDRRHRMLDHLLSRHGENLEEFSAMAYRRDYSTGASTDEQNRRRRKTARRLLREKADFYYAMPALHHSRLQSFGLPPWRKPALVHVVEVPGGYEWQAVDHTGSALMRHTTLAPDEVSARIKAEEAFLAATSLNAYSVLAEGPVFRIAITSGIQVIAKSHQTYASALAANAAMAGFRQSLLQLWVTFALAPLEARLYHLLEIETKDERRKLIRPVTDYFEVYNVVGGRRFRLYQNPGLGGSVLLDATTDYADNAAALAAIDEAIQAGISGEKYVTDLPAAGPFEVRLNDAAGNLIARSPASFATISAASDAAALIRQLLYKHYSAEGFYMVEHILLYPVATTDTPLAIDDAINPCQPVPVPRKDTYSFQITFVFPSGYIRDAAENRSEAQPHRFRDPEFRAYAEQTIRKACPAHILPVILWVDRGDSLPAGAACFDNFEDRYRSWLAAYFTDEVPEPEIGPLRNAVADMLNKLYAAL